MSPQQAEQVAAHILSGDAKLYGHLPNGLVYIRTEWGWLYFNTDGSVHSKQYR